MSVTVPDDVLAAVRERIARDGASLTPELVARALREAVEPDPRATGIPSTKGTLSA